MFCDIPDYSIYFEKISEYAKHMNGSHQISELMEMKTGEFDFWYKIYERQVVEQNIITDCVKKKKDPPSGIAMKNRIDNYIKNRIEEINK